MDCKQIREVLNRFLDQELQQDQVQKVRDHLAKCPLCNLEVERETKFNKVIKNHLSQEEAPYELRERVMNSIEDAGKKDQ